MHDLVIDQYRLVKAPAAVDEAVRDVSDSGGNGIERRDRGRGVVRLDDRQLQARRARVDN
jgi:hypothetical protein